MKPTLIWDLPTRLFHWLFAGCFAVAWLTSEGEAWIDLHLFCGYTMLGLVAFRLIWGFVGSHYARFGSFAFGPLRGFKYLLEVAQGTAKRYLGHNPAGSQAIYLLLLLAVAVGLTGIYIEDTEVHETVANLMLAVVIGHLLGVILESRAHRENLARAMVTGTKLADDAVPSAKPRRLAAASLLAAVLAFAAWWAFFSPQPPAYEEEGASLSQPDQPPGIG
jgi:cytochrome b